MSYSLRRAVAPSQPGFNGPAEAEHQRQLRTHIDAREVVIGCNVVFEPGVTISGINGSAERVVIGDNVYVGGNSKIRVPELVIGDYARLNNHSLIYGYRGARIGHNAWFGQNIVLNSTDDVDIGDNCCIGAYSQLWTHFQFGDVMDGCRFNSKAPLRLGNDVWISGNCVVSPIVAEDRSLAMAGSVVTADMKYNRVYAGNPARDITDKVGNQFGPVSLDEKTAYLLARVAEFFELHPEFDRKEIGVVVDDAIILPGRSLFNVNHRTYTKTRSWVEIAFMRHLLPRAKFVPC
jgi:acetyltransferase-like isoleucine patch superfamily enzyme